MAPTRSFPALYSLPPGDFHDITTGTSTGTPEYSAGAGYDLVTGRGTPYANLIIPALANLPTVPTTVNVDSSSIAITYGQSVTLTATVTADTGSTAPAAGSVEFFDATSGVELGWGTFGGSEGTDSNWTFQTSPKTFNATLGDNISAAYKAGTGFAGSIGTTTETVAARPITIAAMSNVKIYDGTAVASAVPAISAGRIAVGDTAAFTETFDTAGVGVGKTITASGSVNDGNGGNNYAVTFVASTRGQIMPLAITVTATSDTKNFDGTTSSIATPTITTGDLAGNDMPDFSETYDTPAVGTGKTLTPAGSVDDGNSGNDYAVTFAASVTGSITPRAITVDAATDTKAYDGTASSTAVPTIAAGGIVNTLAGSALQTGSSDGTGSAARFNTPWGVGVDSERNVYVADAGNDEIQKIDSFGVVTTLAGSPEQAGSSDGAGTDARFWGPANLAIDSAGNVCVADIFNADIREVTPSGIVTTVAGRAGWRGSNDGTCSAARFDFPEGVAVDSAGNVYVADVYNYGR